MSPETQVVCPTCKACTAIRVNRRGFLQQSVMSRLGYYPWKCGECGCTFLCRSRGRGYKEGMRVRHRRSAAD